MARNEETEVKPEGSVTIVNATGDGKPHQLVLDGDSEVARAYAAHMDKPLVHASDRDNVVETLCHYLAVMREQSVKFDYSSKGCDLHHAATGALFFNQTAYEVVTPQGRNKLIRAIADKVDTREASLMLQAAAITLRDVPRVEAEKAASAKLDLVGLVDALMSKSSNKEELGARLKELLSR